MAESDQALVRCPCRRRSCPRHGDCAACIAHHQSREDRPLPYCRSRKQRKPDDNHIPK